MARTYVHAAELVARYRQESGRTYLDTPVHQHRNAEQIARFEQADKFMGGMFSTDQVAAVRWAGPI